METNYNVSILVVPFYAKSRELIVDNNSDVWSPADNRNHGYLAKHIDALRTLGSNDAYSMYNFAEDSRCNYNLPDKDEIVTMKFRDYYDKEYRTYNFTIEKIKLFYFISGIGLELIYVKHMEKDSLHDISNKSYALSHMFTFEKEKDRRLWLSSSKVDSFSLSEAAKNILCKTGLPETDFDLFPTMQERCIMYHSLVVDELPDDYQNSLFCLRRGMPDTAILPAEKEEFNHSDFTYMPNKQEHWSVCQTGAVSLVDTMPGDDNDYFLRNIYTHNVMHDFLFLFILAIHERHALFRYNAIAVENWNSTKALADHRKQLLRFQSCFAYNAVSDEMAYQNFYDCLYRSMDLDKLEADIENVIDRVEDYDRSHRAAKTNRTLGAIGLLAIASGIIDSFSVVESFENHMVDSWHLMTLFIISAIVVVAIYSYLRKD